MNGGRADSDLFDMRLRKSNIGLNGGQKSSYALQADDLNDTPVIVRENETKPILNKSDAAPATELMNRSKINGHKVENTGEGTQTKESNDLKVSRLSPDNVSQRPKQVGEMSFKFAIPKGDSMVSLDFETFRSHERLRSLPDQPGTVLSIR